MPRIYTLDELRQDHTQIREVFFDAMLAGYASKRPRITSSLDSPHTKVLTYEKDRWLVTDTYHVTPTSDFSSGATVIHFDYMPVWTIQYLGPHPEETIPFLKEVLKAEYGRRRFTGGRGQMSLVGKNYNYINDIEGDFRLFSGTERIRRNDSPEVIGWHRYQGGLMI